LQSSRNDARIPPPSIQDTNPTGSLRRRRKGEERGERRDRRGGREGGERGWEGGRERVGGRVN
jgi:hypothetical protein